MGRTRRHGGRALARKTDFPVAPQSECCSRKKITRHMTVSDKADIDLAVMGADQSRGDA
jgi:hypothetical protein